MKTMRTTKKLSEALALIKIEAINRIKFFFKEKNYSRIHISAIQFLNIYSGIQRVTVNEINSDASILGTVINSGKTQKVLFQPQDLPEGALLTILDELERMKKHNQLKK